jgi:hypothetical protein
MIDQFSDVITETETLDTDIGITSSATVCFQTWLFWAECEVNMIELPIL